LRQPVFLQTGLTLSDYCKAKPPSNYENVFPTAAHENVTLLTKAAKKDVCIDIANGVAYLHEVIRLTFHHNDIK
jgi:hypothetical protein